MNRPDQWLIRIPMEKAGDMTKRPGRIILRETLQNQGAGRWRYLSTRLLGFKLGLCLGITILHLLEIIHLPYDEYTYVKF